LFLTIVIVICRAFELQDHVEMGSPSRRRHRLFTRAAIHVCHDAPKPKELEDMHIIVQLAHHSASSK